MMMKKISEGAESYIYAMDFFGYNCIVKRRLKKNYRLKEIDENIRIGRTKREARVMSIVDSIGIGSPRLLLLDKYDIYMSKISGINLNDILERGKSKSLIKVFRTIGRFAATLHKNNISHGDYTPANIMMDKKMKVYLIDFGLSEITTSMEDKALDILLMKRSIDKRLFSEFLKGYNTFKYSREILRRLEQIEKRGRYNARTIMTKQEH